MNYRVTIGFLAAALVLAVIVVGLDRFNIGPTQTANANATATTTASQQPAILQFDDTKVTALELTQAENSVKVEKQGDTWVVAGTADPANRSSFTSLLVRMSTLKATRAVSDASTDLSQYGLAPPGKSITAQLDDGTRYELLLGGKTPVQTGTYAKKADAPEIYVIADQFASDVERLIGDPREPATPTPRPAILPTPGVTPPPVP
jgi:hypothetical protein